MPRRRVDSQLATEQIAKLKPVLYITGRVCYGESMSGRAGLQSGTHTLKCGCIRCAPELWCIGTDENGQRCEHQACYPEAPEKAQWCRQHYRDVVRRQQGEIARSAPAGASQEVIHWMMAAAGRVGK